MPLNSYQGACGVIFDATETEDYIPCSCGTQDCLAAWIVLPLHSRARNQQLASFVYYENEYGQVMPAGATHEIVPNGYARREAHTFTEMRQLERRMTRQELDKREWFIEAEQREREEVIAEHRRELRTMMEQGFNAPRYAEDGTTITHYERCEFSEKGKDFAREMMARNDTKPGIYDKRVDPGVHIKVLHYDDDHR